MVGETDELKKMIGIATDLSYSADLRIKAVQLIGKMGTREALQALLALAGNEKLLKDEREAALKHARDIIRAGR